MNEEITREGLLGFNEDANPLAFEEDMEEYDDAWDHRDDDLGDDYSDYELEGSDNCFSTQVMLLELCHLSGNYNILQEHNKAIYQ